MFLVECDAEVDDHEVFDFLVAQKQIARLDVAVNDVAAVRDRQTLCDTPEKAHDFAESQGFPAQPLRKIFAFHPLHGEIGLALRSHTVTDVGHDPEMTQLGQDFCFLQKPGGFLSMDRAPVQHFERHRAARGSVFCPVNGRAAPALDLPGHHKPPIKDGSSSKNTVNMFFRSHETTSRGWLVFVYLQADCTKPDCAK